MPEVQAAGPAVCQVHSDEDATWRCTGCGNAYCDHCMEEDTETRRETCPGCQGFCRRLADPDSSSVSIAQGHTLVLACIVTDALSFPFRGTVPFLVLVSALFLSFIDFLAMIFWHPLLLIGFLMLGCGYFVRIAFNAIDSASRNEQELPRWPSPVPLDEQVAFPMLQFVAVLGFSYGPAAACMVGSMFVDSILLPVLTGLLGFAGAVYWPMAFLSVALHGSTQGMRPSLVVPAITAIPVPYFAVWMLGAAITGLAWLVQFPLGFMPLFGGVLAYVVQMAAVVFCVRLLGLLYHAYDRRIGWF